MKSGLMSVVRLFEDRTKQRGVIALEKWPEGYVLWFHGEWGDDWRYDDRYSVWMHPDGRFVTDRMLCEAKLADPEEYCRHFDVKVLPKTGDYTRLSNGYAMHSGFPERVTYRKPRLAP